MTLEKTTINLLIAVGMLGIIGALVGAANNEFPRDQWQTYRNEEYGFELQYPKNWYVDTTYCSFIVLIPLEKRNKPYFDPCYDAVVGIVVDERPLREALEDWEASDADLLSKPWNGPVAAIEQIILDSVPVTKIVYGKVEYKGPVIPEEINQASEKYQLVHNERLFIISINRSDPVVRNKSNEILSTLRFFQSDTVIPIPNHLPITEGIVTAQELRALGENNTGFNNFLHRTNVTKFSLVEETRHPGMVIPAETSVDDGKYNINIKVVYSEPDSFVDITGEKGFYSRIDQCGTVCSFQGAAVLHYSRIITWGTGAACDLIPNAPQTNEMCDKLVAFVNIFEEHPSDFYLKKRYVQFLPPSQP